MTTSGSIEKRSRTEGKQKDEDELKKKKQVDEMIGIENFLSLPLCELVSTPSQVFDKGGNNRATNLKILILIICHREQMDITVKFI